MKKNKKRGNTLLLMIVLAMVLVVLGSTLSTAIAYTTKNNIVVKKSEDLTYAAEAGIEYAIAKLKNDGLTNKNYDTDDLTGDSLKYNLYGNICKIRVEVGAMDVITKQIPITSIATDNTGKTRSVDCKVRQKLALSGNVFNNSAITLDKDLQIDGAVISAQSTNLNSGNNYIKNVESGTVWPNKNPPFNYDERKNVYESIEYIPQVKRVKSVTINKVSDLNGTNQYRDENGVLKNAVNLTDYVSGATSYLADFPGVGFFDTPGGYKVYIVNSDELNILCNGVDTVNQSIIINNGDIKIKKASAAITGTTIHAIYSTFLSNGISLTDQASLTLDYPPVGDPTQVDWLGKQLTYVNPAITFSLTAGNYIEFDTRLAKLIKNWSSASSPPSTIKNYAIVPGTYSIN